MNNELFLGYLLILIDCANSQVNYKSAQDH